MNEWEEEKEENFNCKFRFAIRKFIKGITNIGKFLIEVIAKN